MDKQSSESQNLDLLRAVAVLCVFGSHLILTLMPSHHVYERSQTPTVALLYALGRVGVLMFFVHTSLVLLLSLERTRQPSLFLNFYIRRLFRIYPLSIACILVVLLFRIPWVPELAFAAPGWPAILSNVLLIQNLTRAKDLISPLWTLPWEVQMYAVLPVIFVLLRRFGSVPMVLILWFMAAAAAPHIYVLMWFPCFMGGVFAYQMAKVKTHRGRAAFWPVLIVATVALYLSVPLPDYVPCMILGALVSSFPDLAPSWVTGASHLVARYSYGIYLFHLPIIWFSFVKLRFLPVPLQWAALCILMCLIPWAAYRWLEAPLIKTGQRVASRLGRPKDEEASNLSARGLSQIEELDFDMVSSESKTR